MGELDAEARTRRRQPLRRRQLACHRRLAGIRIEARAAMGDAADALHAGGLDHHEAGAGHGELRPVLAVPHRIGATVVGAVLAHRRDDDAVGQLQRPKTKRREQGCGHGDDRAVCCW
jgi:hypothetical protein